MSSLRKINIKNRAYHCPDDITNIKVLDSDKKKKKKNRDKILVYKKIYQNNFISCVACIIPDGGRPFDKVLGCIEKYGRNTYLSFFLIQDWIYIWFTMIGIYFMTFVTL